MKIAISSGHGLYVRGASGLIDEVDEARRVVSALAEALTGAGHDVVEIHDNVSTTQDANLKWLVNQHNALDRDFDLSVHFNAYIPTDGGRGVEVLYVTQEDIARRICDAISGAGQLINRGPKKRTDLYWLNKTNMPACLIETAFVDAAQDVANYEEFFEDIIQAIADVAPHEVHEPPPPAVPEQVTFAGKCSWFGGPMDKGVSSSEGLAFLYDYSDAPHLFLDQQPPNTTGLARRLNADEVNYVACRWDYSKTPKAMLADKSLMAVVVANGREFLAWPADWGPHQDTGRAADISPALMDALGITTDDEVMVIYPHAGG